MLIQCDDFFKIVTNELFLKLRSIEFLYILSFTRNYRSDNVIRLTDILSLCDFSDIIHAQPSRVNYTF
ncbi:hypothetical protein DJFAAGMI_04876 [Comamonas sp. PE63]|uniref:Uncharacterized protein n=1 Tax=Comamonas brasiliensis TaxID=1812482 RepID=A0ABS5LZZ2_9BURK|nr:hypothetical protein [Comamonas sp. PE63]